MKGIPIYFGYSSKIKPEVFYHTMEEVRNRYGVQFGVFDNLHRMIRSGEESDMGKASGMFKDLTMDLNIPFLLIAQPRKLNDEKIPTYDSLKGSSAIPADSDTTILIHRSRDQTDKNNSFNPEATIIVDKSRYSSGGIMELKLIGEKARFDETDERIITNIMGG
jgi:replicative DNA helicase